MSNLRRRRRTNQVPTNWPAFVPYALGHQLAMAVSPTTDTGYKSYVSGKGRLFLAAATNIVSDPQAVLADGTFWPASGTHTATTANFDVPVAVPDELTGLTKCLRLVNDATAETLTVPKPEG